MSLNRTVSWDRDSTNPNSTTVVVAIGRWAARQGDQVGLPLVIKLPVSALGLDPVLQHAI